MVGGGWCDLTVKGGFGGFIGHDSHILYTLSAIQILVIYDALGSANIESIAKCWCRFCRSLLNAKISFHLCNRTVPFAETSGAK